MNIQGLVMTVLALALLGLAFIYAQRIITSLAARAGV
jgi:hypothetical protein